MRKGCCRRISKVFGGGRPENMGAIITRELKGGVLSGVLKKEKEGGKFKENAGRIALFFRSGRGVFHHRTTWRPLEGGHQDR